MLPLFPLRVVLFPGTLLPLHIFESRYQQLLADVTPGEQCFGLLPPGEEGGLPPAGRIGCAARVRGVQPLPEGRANIVVSGERRFRFLQVVAATTPYAQGIVEWVDDQPDVQVPSDADLARLRGLGERYALARQRLRDQALDLEFSADAAGLSFEVAALLDWDFEAGQRLLESRSATERVVRLLQVLPGLARKLEERARHHEDAKTNGHGVAR